MFKGLAGTRTVYNGVKYALHNPKVMTLSAAKSPAVGAGAAIKGLKPTLKGNVLTVVIVGVVDLVAWQNGMLSDDGKFISDFIVEFGMDIAKAMVSAVVAGVVVGVGCMLAAAFTSIAAIPIVIIVGGGIIAAIACGMLLDYFDEKNGFTAELRNRSNEVEMTIGNAIAEKIVQPICQTLYQLEKHIESLYLSQFQIPFY